jgi:hypothetical protein
MMVFGTGSVLKIYNQPMLFIGVFCLLKASEEAWNYHIIVLHLLPLYSVLLFPGPTAMEQQHVTQRHLPQGNT